MKDQRTSPGLSRRGFLKAAAAAGFGAVVSTGDLMAQYQHLRALRVENPLAQYPNRDWERVYRDIFQADRTEVFLCAPNDTHNCLLRAVIKNDVVIRIEPTYGYSRATDLSGNGASPRWDPRCCQKGLVLTRRQYGDRRVKGAFLRAGFKAWVDAGFPRDATTGAAPPELMRRGFDAWEKVTYEEAHRYHALAMENIARTYSGEQGQRFLAAQGFDADSVAATAGAGVRTLKFRGGMALLGATRLFGQFRMANGMALLDAKVRGVGPDEAQGAGSWDSYTFHTDLPPGHPMVTGEQTNDFELFDTENAGLIFVWGMNWITTKMPDSHWLTEARMKGAQTVAVTVEYSATATKCDHVVVIRPGTDPALALGVAQLVIAENRFDAAFVKRYTDLTSLVRMDTLERVRPSEIGAQVRRPSNWTHVVRDAYAAPAAIAQDGMYITEAMLGEFDGTVVWDATSGVAVAVPRDAVGDRFDALGVDPDLRGSHTVTIDGQSVEVRPVFSLVEEYLNANMTPAQCQRITWAPEAAIRKMAELVSENRGRTLFACGMGPNQFFNQDLKDRAVFLLASLTGSVGRHGGNVGSYAGNYMTTLFGGIPKYTKEDPFHLQLRPDGPVHEHGYSRYESMHYWANGERLSKAGDKTVTLGAHVPTPTKAIWQTNSNSSLGNQKGHYDVVFNTLPRVECVVYSDWWWTGSCEYSDIVYGVDSWLEFKRPDMTASNTNPFLQVFPDTTIPRAHDTRGDMDILAGFSAALATITGDERFNQLWHFVHEGRPEVYLQRILDASPMARGYRFEDILARAREGTPSLINSRTYPRINSYEQVAESRPWHTKTGRLEFYRPELEFVEAGENLPLYREPSDATFYDPCAIVAAAHPAVRPKRPADWGIAADDRSHMARQMRNTTHTVDELLATHHPLHDRGFRTICHTPKYRHGSHTTPVDTDYMAVLFGPFGDMHRHDRRMPSVGEMYIDIHPDDAREAGVKDGDYVWVDGDPDELPFRGWNDPARAAEYKVARLMLRARYYPGTPRGVTRIWHNSYGATPSSVAAHESREDGLAKSADTNYQAMFRYGSHQSLTRTWLKPTLQTATLVSRQLFGNVLVQGFQADVHCVNGAPRESLAKITHAEDGGIGGRGTWRPVTLGFRPGNENDVFSSYLRGGFKSHG